MKYQEELLNLYKITRTPMSLSGYLTEDYKSFDIFSLLLRNTYKDVQGTLTYLPLSPMDIEDMVLFLLKSVNTPRDLHGLLLLKPCIFHILKKGCDEGKSPSQLRRDLSSVCRIFFHNLNVFYKTTPALFINKEYDARIVNHRPHVTDHPLSAYQLVAYQSDPAFYDAYAYILHKKIRFNESLALKTSTYASYVRTGRYFFEYTQEEIKTRDSTLINKKDLIDIKGLIRRVLKNNGNDAASTYIGEKLTPEMRDSFKRELGRDAISLELQTNLINMLNTILGKEQNLHNKLGLTSIPDSIRDYIDEEPEDKALSFMNRFIFELAFPNEIKTWVNVHPHIESKEFKVYIDAFVEGYDVQNGNPTTKTSETASQYKQRFDVLLNEKTPSSREFISDGGTAQEVIDLLEKENDKRDVGRSSPANGVTRVSQKTSPFQGIKEYPVRTERALEPDEEEDYGAYEPKEAPHYYTYQENVASQAQRPFFGRRVDDFIHLQCFHFSWDENFLNLFHYGLIYKALQSAWKEASSLNEAVIIYIYLLIHTGMDPIELLKLIRSNKDEDIKTPVLINIGERYYISHPSIVELKKPPDCARCKPASSKVLVPLPYKISIRMEQLLANLGRTKYVFSYRIDDKLNRLSLSDVARFLILEVSSRHKQYDLKISPAVISRSFTPLYMHAFGLDPLICNHISGTDHYRQYKSQMHYIHIPHKALETEYLKTHKLVEEAISENQNRCIEEGFIEGGKLARTREALVRGNQPETENLPGYGSTIICPEEYIISIVEKLRHLVDEENDVIKRHNRFSIYTYLCLQFSTCQRPKNNPDLSYSDFDSSTKSVIIRDKQSAKYLEERILPVTPVMATLLETLRDKRKALIDYITGFINPAVKKETDTGIRADKFFFLIDEKGFLADFSRKEVHKLLVEAGLQDTMPNNMPRHFTRDYLYHAGICNDAADAWMGHQHNGKEALNISSSAGSIRSICLPVIEELIDRLGFTPLSYLPKELT